MAFKVFTNHDQGTLFVVDIVAIVVCTTAVALRFISASSAGRSLMSEDWLALAALVTFGIYAGCSMRIVMNLNGANPFIRGSIPIPVLLETYKLGYVMNIQTPLNQTFAKLSLLALYHRIFGVNTNFVRLVWAVGGAQIVWCIVLVLVRLFSCHPIAGGYDPLLKAKCIDSNIILAAGDSINSLLDFIMVAMAVWMVYKLQMTNSNKLKLSILFVLGGFSGIIGIIKISEAYGTIGSSVTDASWNIGQQGTSIICCCAPIYKPLLHELRVFQVQFFSYLSSSSRKKMLTKGHSDDSRSQSEHATYPAGRNGDVRLLPLQGVMQSTVNSDYSDPKTVTGRDKYEQV